MTGKISHQKNGVLPAAIVFGALILLTLVMYPLLSQKPVGHSGFTCAGPEYQSVKNGMSKAKMSSLLGPPDSKRVKDSADQNFFFQGENEAKIKEGWIYKFAGYNNAEIYFDNTGVVNGKGCGQG